MIIRIWRGWTAPANADTYETASVPKAARRVLCRFDARSRHDEIKETLRYAD